MNQLETLLNSLIKMGWKPWGKLEANECTVEYQKQVCIWSKHYRMLRKGSLRELVSLESGLWQFCAEKGFVNIDERNTAVYRKAYPASETEETISSDRDYQYRLLESALVPEEELEKFLFDNIKTE